MFVAAIVAHNHWDDWHRALGEFTGRARLTTWLYRILDNAANERRRARVRRPSVSLESAGAEAERADDDDAGDPIRLLHARRLAAVVREFFAALPAGQREVVELVDHQGMRPVEVAEALEMNAVTVRAHLFKARRALRSRILERYPELMEGYER